MQSLALELNGILDKYLPALESISGAEYNFKPSANKWSKKEILGHMVDSAQNNIRRFIVAQYDEQPKIIYDQDKWVSLINYQSYNLPELVSLWYLSNKHICQILKFMSPEMAVRESETENLHTLYWLAKDYIKHLLHHLHQVLNMEPVAYS